MAKKHSIQNDRNATRARMTDETPRAEQATAGVILCGGKGTRMGMSTSHKVCVPVAGRAAVVRLIDTLRADGVDPIIVVVGHRAGEVVETVGAAHPGVHFVYQRDQLGTGHAARIGVEALAQLGFEGRVLVTMGDKWFAPGLVKGITRRFLDTGAELLAVSTPKRSESTAGRLVELDGRGVVGIVEQRDIDRLRVLEDWQNLAERKKTLTREALRRAGLARIKPVRKLWRALGPLSRYCRGRGTLNASEVAQVIRETGTSLMVGRKKLGADAIEKTSPTVNESVYLARIQPLTHALRNIGRANAQDEYYLTDIVEIMQRGMNVEPDRPRRARVIQHALPVHDVMAFNTRRELKRIESHVKQLERDPAHQAVVRRLARHSRNAPQWLELLKADSAKARNLIERTYGAGGSLVANRVQAMRRLVRLFARTYDEQRRFFMVRAPGRINLMGRHIDHQGGHVHVVALDCEVLMAVRPRTDEVIRLVNADAVAFPRRELVLSDWRAALRADDWLNFVDGRAVRNHLLSTAGDWSNYILASALYQQFHHMHRRLRGMDVAVLGNVPMASGLSSSSSLVVAAMEAVNAVNGIEDDGPAVVDACGQAEWFVGSRGGAADHAAIRLGRAGHAARIGFHPFRLDGYVPVPEQAAILVAYSGQHAVKSAGARDRFNERVANYHIGIQLLRKKYPRAAARLHHIRDLSPQVLGVSQDEVWDMIASLPEKITRQSLRQALGPGGAELCERMFVSHQDPGEYTVRDVVAYGVGECERSRLAADWLRRSDLETFGTQMVRSHDGDRVSGRRRDPGPRSRDEFQRDGTSLADLVGAYACSTRNIDRLVDTAMAVPGVYGAQLAGAGLGGCVMILAQRKAARRVVAELGSRYYAPQGLEPAIWNVRSVHGGGLIHPGA